MKFISRLVMTDSYKTGQYQQVPDKTTSMASYFESRGSERGYTETTLFGLQYFLKQYWSEPITIEEIEEAREFAEDRNEPFNYEGWLNILNKHNGMLPIRVRAIPEGEIVPLKVALFTVESTDEEFYWLPDWVETAFCRMGWYGGTVVTQDIYIHKAIYQFLQETSDNPDLEIGLKLHDFGARGASSSETAQIGGAAHMLMFQGTDTLEGVWLMKHFYNEWRGLTKSIPASQHSTISAWGKKGEADAYRNMLNLYKGNGILACVSDTWDIFNACENIWGGELRQEVIDSGALVVIRPDSGDPVTVVLKCLNILEEKFGVTINSKGYKVLNYVRLIQGDGINPTSIVEILQAMKDAGYSATNIAFGMGGALLQKVDRDTLKYAYKCSSITVDGEVREVYKDPVTDKGKTSKKGRLDTVRVLGYPAASIKLADDQIAHPDSIMRTVYENGKLLVDENFSTIRERALTRGTSCRTMGK